MYQDTAPEYPVVAIMQTLKEVEQYCKCLNEKANETKEIQESADSGLKGLQEECAVLLETMKKLPESFVSAVLFFFF